MKANFRFYDEYLEYSGSLWDDPRSGFNIKYEEIPGEFEYKNYSPKPPATIYVFAIIAALTLGHVFVYGHGDVRVLGFIAPLFLLAWALVLAERKWWRKSCTILPTHAGALGIARDRRHDAILGELQARRATALSKLVEIDEHGDPWQQLKVFKFLRDEAIISEEQFATYRRQLLASRDDLSIDGFCPVDGSRPH